MASGHATLGHIGEAAVARLGGRLHEERRSAPAEANHEEAAAVGLETATWNVHDIYIYISLMDHGQYLVHSSKSSLFEEGIMVLMTIEMTIHVHCIIKKIMIVIINMFINNNTKYSHM